MLKVAMASYPGTPGRINEDFVGAVPGAAVLLDGAGITGAEAICHHGVAWFTHRLGGELIGRLARPDGPDLVTVLGDAIEQIAGEHRHSCDIANPSSPQATVMIMRVSAQHIEYLALADCYLLAEHVDGRPHVITDQREVNVRRRCTVTLEGLPRGTAEYDRVLGECIEQLRDHRNQPGGYWIAKDDPRAAAEAVTGRLPIDEITAAALISNGASRIVDPYHLVRWQDLPELLATGGPTEVIRHVRHAETSGHETPFANARDADDASISYCTELRAQLLNQAPQP